MFRMLYEPQQLIAILAFFHFGLTNFLIYVILFIRKEVQIMNIAHIYVGIVTVVGTTGGALWGWSLSHNPITTIAMGASGGMGLLFGLTALSVLIYFPHCLLVKLLSRK